MKIYINSQATEAVSMEDQVKAWRSRVKQWRLKQELVQDKEIYVQEITREYGVPKCGFIQALGLGF